MCRYFQLCTTNFLAVGNVLNQVALKFGERKSSRTFQIMHPVSHIIMALTTDHSFILVVGLGCSRVILPLLLLNFHSDIFNVCKDHHFLRTALNLKVDHTALE